MTMTTEKAIKLATEIPDIESMRAERDNLRKQYDSTPDLLVKRDLGREINHLNDKINAVRMNRANNAVEYAKAAQILEADVSMMKGKIDQIELELKDGEISRDLMAYEQGIEDYRDMIHNLLPDGFDNPEELAKHVEESVEDEYEKWYNPDGTIKDIYLDEMKYGESGVDSVSVIEEDGKIRKDGVVPKYCKTCEANIADAGKEPMLSSSELKNISMLNTPEKIIEALEERCAANRRRAYENALGKIDEKIDGNMVDSVGVTCKISHKEIKDAFEHKMKIEEGVPGSGREYIKDFLKDIFGDKFSEADYERMSEYDDVCSLTDDISKTCLENGIYDTGLIDYGVSNIDRSALINVKDTINELDNVFGDQFTKSEYETVARKIVDADKIINSNKENLMSQFRGTRADSQIRAAKIMMGIMDTDGKILDKNKNEKFTSKWEEVRQKLIKSHVNDVEGKLKKKQLEEARDIFNNAISKVDENTFLYKENINDLLNGMGLQKHLVRRMMLGVDDLDSVIDNNRVHVNAAMKTLVKKKGMLKDDVFSERRLESAVREKELKEMGDPKRARDYMQRAISNAVGNVDMSDYEKSLSDMCCKKIETDFDTMDKVINDFIARKKSFIEMVSKRTHAVAEDVTRSLYAGEGEDEYVKIPEEETKVEKIEEKEKETKVERKNNVKHLIPFPETERYDAKINILGRHRPGVSPAQERRENAFFNKGLILKKAIGKNKYRVYGKGNEYIEFGDVKALDRWLKEQY